MSTACLMITTDLPHRTEMTLKALSCVDEAGRGTFDQKVLSIDLQPGLCADSSHLALRKAATDLGWQVVEGWCTGHRAMLNNISRGLAVITADNLFYCEDHVFVERVPSRSTIQFLFSSVNIGWVCYNTHVHQENLLNVPGFIESADRPIRFAFINDPSNWHTINDEDFLVKAPPIRDEYYLNFPVALAPRPIFTRLMDWGLVHYNDVGIEVGFTRAWFDLQMDQSHEVLIYVKPGTTGMLPFESFKQMHNQACMRFRNNDPSMLHPSVVPHQSCPQQSNQKRSFF